MGANHSGAGVKLMTAAVQAVLRSFDALSDDEQREVAIEVLRRTAHAAQDELPDGVLISLAESVFRELDTREEADAHPAPG
jgi:hypothetical protein